MIEEKQILEGVIIPTNKYQTAITRSLLDSYPKEVQEDFFGYVNNVLFIQRLISPDRKYAKDLKRDVKGRIIVDLVNPHILEDMNYFRPSAIHFQEHDCFTKLRVNRNKNSEYMKWFLEEVRRCREGYVRESDGEWVTGDMYFYLNYTPFELTKKVGRRTMRIVDHPRVWEGVYWRFHYFDQARYGGLYNDFKGNQHCIEVARRACSKSFCSASKMVKHFLLGIDEFEKEKVKILAIASSTEYLGGKDGLLKKFYDMINWLIGKTQFPTSRIKDSFSTFHWVSGWEDSTNKQNKGSLNECMGVSIADDPDKIRGKRAQLQIFEEFAAFSKFIDTYNIAQPNVELGTEVFGLNIAQGTGGSPNSSFAGALEMINNPGGYNVYGLPDVFRKGANGSKNTIFFFPEYICRDITNHNEDGVSDVVGAILDELSRRYEIKYGTSNPSALSQRKAEHPITLDEAILKADTSFFPVADLNDALFELDNNPHITNSMLIGRLELDSNGKVRLVPDLDSKPITEFPLNNNHPKGAVQIKEMPVTNKDGNVHWGRYIASLDPVDNDGDAQSTSLISCFVLDLWTDELVAEYTGREYIINDSYEVVRRLCILYNCQCLYENNKKGFYSFMLHTHSLKYLAPTPDYIRDRLPGKQLMGNTQYGITASEPIIHAGLKDTQQWLVKPIEVIKQGKDESGEAIEESVTTPNLKRIPFRALLKELTMYNRDGNFDRVDSLMVLMLFRTEKITYLKKEDSVSDPDYLGNDKYFVNNYRRRVNPEKDILDKFQEIDKKINFSPKLPTFI